jgi:hypothetical protein
MSRIVDEVRELLGPHDPAPGPEPIDWGLRSRVLDALDDDDPASSGSGEPQPASTAVARRLAVAAIVVVLGGAAVAYQVTADSSPDQASTTGGHRGRKHHTATSVATTIPATAPPVETTVPATTPSTVPTTTPPPVGTGFPDATNTGPAPGTQFAPMAGGGTIRQDGLVIENVQISDGLDVYANDVTIRNCRIEASGYWAVQLRDGYSNLTIENCELYGNGSDHLEVAIKNIGDGQINVRRNNIHTSTDGFMGGRGLVEDNYIHDLKEFPGDHVDGIQSNGSSSEGELVIRHNTVLNPVGQTSAIILAPTFSALDRITIENNLLGGGGYTLYGGEAMPEHPYGVTNLVVRNNVFTRRLFPKGGYYGPVAHWDPDAAGNVWSNNTWEDTGALVEP